MRSFMCTYPVSLGSLSVGAFNTRKRLIVY